MPTFDIVSEIDKPELQNAVDNAKRELSTRFDFRGVEADIELTGDDTITVKCEVEDKPIHSGKTFSLNMKFKNGLESATAKYIVKAIKESGSKVKATIQGEKVRVEGKKRDELQAVMALLREDKKIEQDLQFNNMRD